MSLLYVMYGNFNDLFYVCFMEFIKALVSDGKRPIEGARFGRGNSGRECKITLKKRFEI